MLRALMAALSLCLLLTGCGGGVEDPPLMTGGAGGGLEKSEISVGTVPVLGVAPLHIAIAKGYFAEEGLSVTPQVFPSGPASLTAAIAGEVDLTFASYIPLLNAQANGAATLRIIAEGSASSPNSFGIYTMPGSPIRQAADLAGRKIGVNGRNNIPTVLTSEALRTAGVDPASVAFVEVPFPEMGATLERGDVDAVFLAEPFITAVSAQRGVVRVVDAGIGTVDSLPIDGYATTEGWAKQHPRVAAAFQRAIQRAAADAANRAEAQAVVTDYAKVDPVLAPLLAPLNYPTSLNAVRLQRVADLMESQGLLKKRLDVAAFTGIPQS